MLLRGNFYITIESFSCILENIASQRNRLQLLLETSGVSTQSGAHGKVYMCTLSYCLNLRYSHNFYER